MIFYVYGPSFVQNINFKYALDINNRSITFITKSATSEDKPP